MEIFYQRRGTGKTCMLIMLSARNQIPIGVVNTICKYNIKEKARQLGYTIPDPIIIEKLSDLESCGDIYIDDFDLMLDKLSHKNVKGITMSDEIKTPNISTGIGVNVEIF